MRHFTHQCLFVRLPFTSDDEVSIFYRFVEIGKIKHYVNAGMQLCLEICEESIA